MACFEKAGCDIAKVMTKAKPRFGHLQGVVLKKTGKYLKKIICLIMALSMVTCFVSHAEEVETEEELQDRKAEVQSEMSELQAQLDEIFTAMTEIEEQMEETRVMIEVAQRSLSEVQVQENHQYNALKKRIKYFYEEGNDQLLMAFLEASDLADVYRRIEYVRSINAYDRTLLEEYIQTRLDITALEEELMEEEQFLLEEQVAYALRQEELSSLIESKRAEIENLDQLIAEAEQRAREEAERQKALLEEARQKALADARNRQSGNNSGNSQSGNSSGNSQSGNSGSGTDSGFDGTGSGDSGESGGGNTGEPTRDTSNLWYCSMSTSEIYVYLINSGMTSEGAAGMLGNLYAESGLRSTNLENKYNSEFGLSDSEYTAAVDNGSYSNFIYDKGGYGLAQWTYSTRKKGLYNYCVSCGASIGNAQVQLQYLVIELTNNYPELWNILCSTEDIKYASDCVLTQFEKPKNQSDSVKELRYNYALSLTQ